MQKMLFFESIWSQRTMSCRMKTMLDKVPNRERVSNGISVDVFLLFGAGLWALFCYVFLFYFSMIFILYRLLYCYIYMCSIHFDRLELFAITGACFFFVSFYRCCIPSSKYMFLIYLYRHWQEYLDRLVIHVIEEHVSIKNRSTSEKWYWKTIHFAK